tara:strand:+ start:235 stop:996 length:762 start_codon:yes stop_codon:yes gene_type:complete
MKKLILFLLSVPIVLSGQVETSKESIDRASSRKKIKLEKEEFEGSLKIIVATDYDPNRSLTIDKTKGEWIMGKKSRQLFEDAMFSEGFFVTDINSIDKRFKISKKGGLLEEGEIAIGRTNTYSSAYIMRFKKNQKKDLLMGFSGKLLKSKIGLISDFDLRIIDLSQSSKVVARVFYDGPSTNENIIYPILAKGLRSKIKEKGLSNPSLDSKKTSKDDAINELKKIKELLDMDLISKDEFDKKATELKKIILGN